MGFLVFGHSSRQGLKRRRFVRAVRYVEYSSEYSLPRWHISQKSEVLNTALPNDRLSLKSKGWMCEDSITIEDSIGILRGKLGRRLCCYFFLIKISKSVFLSVSLLSLGLLYGCGAKDSAIVTSPSPVAVVSSSPSPVSTPSPSPLPVIHHLNL